MLRVYAHSLYLGTAGQRTIVGVEEASRVYFGKRARELTIGEAATPVAMSRSPHAFSPHKYPDRLTARRNRLLAQLGRSGTIRSAHAAEWMAEPLRARPAV